MMKVINKNKDAIPEIVQKGEPVLRKKAETINVAEIKSAKFQKILLDMKRALATQDDGVALAAPQIGLPLRIFVVSENVFTEATKRIKEGGKGKIEALNNTVYINPEIIKISRKKEFMEEGCLSVRWLYGKVKRSVGVTIRAYDENGVQFERGAGGLLAQIFQHETDHLKGTLFIDNAIDVHELLPEDQEPNHPDVVIEK